MSVTNTIPANNTQFISLALAEEMTTAYRNQKESLLTSNYTNQGILPLSETFNRSAIDSVLASEGCAALRIYYGMDENLKIHAILVGVTDTNEDILPLFSRLEGDDTIVETGQRCPDLCPPPSPLNG